MKTMPEWASTVSQRAWSKPIKSLSRSQDSVELFEAMESLEIGDGCESYDSDCWSLIRKIRKRTRGYSYLYFKMKSC